MASTADILYLFDRPAEPVYVPKGEEKVNFSIPNNYLPDEYQQSATSIFNRFGGEASRSVPVKKIAIPDLSIPLQLGRRAPFSLFLASHREMASRLIEIMMGMRTYDDLLSLSVFCRDRINTQMFIYALSVAVIHRDDTKNLPIPILAEIFPDKFIDSTVFAKAKEEAHVVQNGSRNPIEIPLNYTATDVDLEHRVAYWREDIGINLHHWHWHLVYPYSGPDNIVRKDRRGELFYYMHHQIMARYNIERFCNRLPRVKNLSNLRDPIEEAYFPKLDSMVAGRSWPSRPAGSRLHDLNRKKDKLKVDIQSLERFRDRIFEAIQTKSARTANGTVQLTEMDGIDLLGNMVEASPVLSPNFAYYGDLHNDGHNIISYCHDPDHRYLEEFGIMGDPTTAMRDPVFYRWHNYIDELFASFKNTLPAYTTQQLQYQGITISDISVNTPNANKNELQTFWSKSDVDLSRGLDFIPRGPIFARFTHLNHAPFTYNITAQNATNQQKLGTVRIFIGPKVDETGYDLVFEEQRNWMIELDKFTVSLKPGANSIVRQSTASALTIPFEATFRDLDRNRPAATDLGALDAFNFCGCGWPQHMLIPKGTKSGFPMDLFVMISNYDDDKIDQPEPTGCRTGVSFCGLRDRKYPDKRSMGYPFDRIARPNVVQMSQFLTSNMKVSPITIKFTDTIKTARHANPNKK